MFKLHSMIILNVALFILNSCLVNAEGLQEFLEGERVFILLYCTGLFCFICFISYKLMLLPFHMILFYVYSVVVCFVNQKTIALRLPRSLTFKKS